MPQNFLLVGFKAQFFRQRLSCSEKIGSDSQSVPLDLNAQRGKRRREHVHRRKHAFLSLHRRCRRIEKAVIHAAMAVSAQLLFHLRRHGQMIARHNHRRIRIEILLLNPCHELHDLSA